MVKVEYSKICGDTYHVFVDKEFAFKVIWEGSTKSIVESLNNALKGYIKESDIDEYEIYNKWHDFIYDYRADLYEYGIITRVRKIIDKNQLDEFLQGKKEFTTDILELSQSEIRALKALIKERSYE